jgi:ketosteroid isomerase-like protein
MTSELESLHLLEKLVVAFTEAFNREDIDEVMSYFAEDAIYDEFNDIRHEGLAAIRKAFEPQFSGAFGKMRFHTEDMFLDVGTSKAMTRWVLTLEGEDRAGAYRGLDLLLFNDGKLVEKHTYCKAKVPFIRKKADMTAAGNWPA